MTVRRKRKESLGDIEVEVSWIRAGTGAEIALTRVPPGSDAHGTPVILVHGNFSNRGFWISPKGVGLAPFLAERGYDAWIVELRGHGLSPKDPRFSSITAEDHIRADLPAAVRHVREQTGKRMFLAGHSAGGIFLAALLSARCVDPEALRGVALFGTQVSHGWNHLKFPPSAWFFSALLRTLGRVPSRRLGLGPEDEPAGEFLEFIRWKRRGWRDAGGVSYWEGLRTVRLPLLAVAGTRDTNDPPEGCREMADAFGSRDKRFVLLSKENRFSLDYDHIGMIVSKQAAEEVWPLLADWMDGRREP